MPSFVTMVPHPHDGPMRFLALVLSAACAGTPAAPPPAPDSEQGEYRFTASVPTPGGGVWLEGAFRVVGDTLLLDLKGADCVPLRGGTDTFGYRCPGQFASGTAQQTVTGATFSFWRHRPTERPSVSVSVSTQSTRNTCVQYTTDSNGARTCARSSKESVFISSTHSALLKLVPAR